MAFVPVQYEVGKLVPLQVAATTFTKGDACVPDGSGQMTKATAGNGAEIRYIIMETVATTATAGDIKSFLPVAGVRFIADTTATPTQAQCGTHVDLVTNAATIDTAATTDKLFYVEAIKGAAADKKVFGYFQTATPHVE